MRIRSILFFVLIAVTVNAYASDVKVTVTEVKDTRSTGEFFNNLEIKLKLIGDDVSSVRGIKPVVRTAVDDTGRNLLLDSEKADSFESVSESRATKPEITLKFKNPARKADVVKEISGELQLFMPKKDPSATLLVNNFMKSVGKPIKVRALTRAGITMTVLTKKEYDVLKKKQENKAKEAAKKQGATEALISAFEGLFNGFFQVGDNDLLLKISDPSKNLIDVDVVDANGDKIQSRGKMKSNDLTVLNYRDPLPQNAKLRLFLKTKKSVVSVPLRLVDVALP